MTDSTGSTRFSSRLPISLLPIALLAGAVLVLAALLAPGAARARALPGPEGLGFYHPPRSLPKGHGTLIWARRAGGLVPLAEAASTRLVLYTSITPQGKRVSVSGSVSVPKGEPPKGGWPVISYGHGTTGIADTCAPSRNRVGGPVVGYTSYVDPQLNEWLKAGYAVVRSDFQGLGTPARTAIWSAPPRAAAWLTSSAPRTTSTRGSAAASCSPVTRRVATRRCSPPG